MTLYHCKDYPLWSDVGVRRMIVRGFVTKLLQARESQSPPTAQSTIFAKSVRDRIVESNHRGPWRLRWASWADRRTQPAYGMPCPTPCFLIMWTLCRKQNLSDMDEILRAETLLPRRYGCTSACLMVKRKLETEGSLKVDRPAPSHISQIQFIPS